MIPAHRHQHPQPVAIRLGDIELRLAKDAREIEAAQALRYKIFYQEMAAQPTEDMKKTGRDFDQFDNFCDHLVVIDHKKRQNEASGIIATYRLMRREDAAKCGRFYSIDEYNLGPILTMSGDIMELGRSCVDINYRSKSIMQLLWRGIADYVRFYDIKLMFGCASFPGTDYKEWALSLSYLYHYHLAPSDLCPKALIERYVSMNIIEKDQINVREALFKLPPLIKGYLRLGGFVGDGAVIDWQFNTIDVCIIVKTDLVTQRYIKHYNNSRED
ncbi:MAG: GNAT family N-acetyltransferase [Alphaproteobacteria bacterium]|nr:GNAT family N-acetyltransferase [Alphaproteobacteria bacterium]